MSDRECLDKIRSSMKIVISYRKKDRLPMEFIYHELVRQGFRPFYDDLLVPGEYDYYEISSQYRQAGKFGAVILLLSGKSLEPLNYQMRIEYPMAVRFGADIIPVWIDKIPWEVVEYEIYNSYPGLSSCKIIDGEGDISRVPAKIIKALEDLCDHIPTDL